MNKTKTCENIKMLNRHHIYRNELTKLLEGKKFGYTTADGVDNNLSISQDKISRFVYLARKIHHTDPMRVYTRSTAQLDKERLDKQEKLKQEKLEQQRLEQQRLDAEKEAEENSDIASEDRYSILDSDSEEDEESVTPE